MSKTSNRKRRWARYVSIGPCDLTRLVWIARRNGLLCISARKPDMHFYNEIGLYGTRAQVEATEREWRAIRSGETRLGHEVLARKPSAAFGVHLERARDQWTEKELPEATDKPQGTMWHDKEGEAEA